MPPRTVRASTRSAPTKRAPSRTLGLSGGRAAAWVRGLALALSLTAAATGSGQAQDDAGLAGEPAPMIEVVPSLVQLAGTPVRVELLIRDAPPTEAFELELAYDGDVAVVTAVEAGSFLMMTGATPEVTVRTAEPGRLAVSALVADPVAAEADPADAEVPAATPVPPPLPAGAGVLVAVTFAPLARSEGSRPVSVVEATLRGAGGDVVDAEALEAQLTVVEDPPAEARDAALAQADLLAEEAAANSGLAGLASAIERGWRDTARRAGAAASGVGPQLVWLGVLAVSLAVVGVAWYFGRRPAAPAA